MILFIHGEDTYRSLDKLKKIKQRFLSGSNAEYNFREFEGEQAAVAEVSEFIAATPFLANRRLAVLKNFLKESKKLVRQSVEEFIQENKIPDSTIVVFYERGVADRRTVLYKLLNKPKVVDEFKFLEGTKLRNWVKSELAKHDARISNSALDKLCAYVGSDLWQLKNEISKLANYQPDKIISDEDVEVLVRAKIDNNIFNLIDAIGNKNAEAALKVLYEQRELGTEALNIFGMLVYQFRNLITLFSLKQEGYLQREAGTKSKLHPFAVRKTWNQLGNFTFAELKRLYLELLSFDSQLKTGKIDEKNGLDNLVINMCKKWG